MYLLRQGLCGSLQIPDIPDFSRPFLILKLEKSETVTRMEGGWFSEWGSRLGAAEIRLQTLQQLHGWGRLVFKMGLSRWRRRHSSLNFATCTRREGRWFSKWSSRLGAADILIKSLQQLHGWRADQFQNGALALAPRTFVLEVCNSYTDGGRAVFKMGLSPWRRGHSS